MDLTVRMTNKQAVKFVEFIQELSEKVGFRISSRGWGYVLENHGFCTKDQFNKVEELINRCRKNGMLPVDFVAEEKSREFECIHNPTTDTFPEHIKTWIYHAFGCDRYFTPDWWEDEKYYIQVIVEKVDLVNLFQDLCEQYHIPIANARGWSSILQRAEYARRFREAQEKGLQCVLLYCGDHDPDGLRISDTLMKNLQDVREVMWTDGTPGYNPKDLIIERFGLDYDFIIRNNLTWIDNLITGNLQKKMDLGEPKHPNHYLPYVQTYLKKVGRRKCEANALVTAPEAGRELFRETIIRYLGDDALDRFREKRRIVREAIEKVFEDSGAKDIIQDAIDKLDEFDN